MLCETPLDLSWRPGKLVHVLRQGQGEDIGAPGNTGDLLFRMASFPGLCRFLFHFCIFNSIVYYIIRQWRRSGDLWWFDVQHESQMYATFVIIRKFNVQCSCFLSDPLNNAINYMPLLFQHNREIKRCFASYTLNAITTAWHRSCQPRLRIVL